MAFNPSADEAMVFLLGDKICIRSVEPPSLLRNTKIWEIFNQIFKSNLNQEHTCDYFHDTKIISITLSDDHS
ncbi:hypothetical protein L1887_21277 [Cichorium endivia]|nr:hypothetical protein L1887_21277 [Cichorium endivia]